MMPARLFFLMVTCIFCVFASPVFARKIGAPAPLTYAFEEDKALEGSDTMPKWTKEDVKIFCLGRSKSIHQDKQQCENLRGKDVGHTMTPAEMQELDRFRGSTAKVTKKAAGKPKKNGKKAVGKIIEEHAKIDHTIVQPPLPSASD